MKKTINIIAVVALAGLIAAPTFARSKNNDRSNPWCHPTRQDSEQQFFPHVPMAGQMQKMGGHEGFKEIDLIGEVTATNAETQILTVKDADGKETQVHVNPFSHIAEKPDAPGEDEKEPARTKKDVREIMRHAQLNFSELKAGDYVAVKKMSTETKTIEAARILVVRKN